MKVIEIDKDEAILKSVINQANGLLAESLANFELAVVKRDATIGIDLANDANHLKR